MAIPFLAGAAAMHLLDDNKQPNVIHHHHYPPLTSEQADVYMESREYINHLNMRCQALFLYRNPSKSLQPKTLVLRHTGERRTITVEGAYILIENEKKHVMKVEKDILMTKGIGSLPNVVFVKDKGIKGNVGLCCCISSPREPDELPEDQFGRPISVKVDQLHFNLLQ